MPDLDRARPSPGGRKRHGEITRNLRPSTLARRTTVGAGGARRAPPRRGRARRGTERRRFRPAAARSASPPQGGRGGDERSEEHGSRWPSSRPTVGFPGPGRSPEGSRRRRWPLRWLPSGVHRETHAAVRGSPVQPHRGSRGLARDGSRARGTRPPRPAAERRPCSVTCHSSAALAFAPLGGADSACRMMYSNMGSQMHPGLHRPITALRRPCTRSRILHVPAPCVLS